MLIGCAEAQNHIPEVLLNQKLQVNEYINASNLCFNLRWPVLGSSSSLMKMMAVGKPCVVTNAPPLNEFPDDILIKIDADSSEVENIEKVMRKIANDDDASERMGSLAKAYIDQNCLWPIVARKYKDFLEKFIGNST